MSLRDLLESGANVSVTVTLDDLRTILNEAAKGAKPAAQEQTTEEFLSRKEVLALLKIDSFDTLVLGENRVYQVLSVRWTETLQTRGCRSDTHRKERRAR